MKQKITKKQWQELSNIEMLFIINYFKGRLFDNGYLFNIGQMIEFLGDDWITRVLDQNYCEDVEAYTFPANNVLCNKLWKAVKFKINI